MLVWHSKVLSVILSSKKQTEKKTNQTNKKNPTTTKTTTRFKRFRLGLSFLLASTNPNSIFPQQEPSKLAKGTAKPSSSSKDGGGENTDEVRMVHMALLSALMLGCSSLRV